MSETTAIQWCDSTFNPWIGCTKVSPGCANCYAERDFDLRKHVAKWGANQPRHRTSAAYWKQPLKWDREAAAIKDAMNAGVKFGPTPPRVFCASLADWLDDEVPIEWFIDLLELVRLTPNLDWLLLSKRPENFAQRVESAVHHCEASSKVWGFGKGWLAGHSPANVWIGTTVEDQARADERIPALLKIPARVRFLSVEPMLGPVDFRKVPGFNKAGSAGVEMLRNLWVICGGESGPKARPMHPEWAGLLRDQCAAAGVPFFMKQMGGTRKPFPEIPADLSVRMFPEVLHA